MNENLKTAISSWQEENKENRAIIVVAFEKTSSDENSTSANIAPAQISLQLSLVSTKTSSKPFRVVSKTKIIQPEALSEKQS